MASIKSKAKAAVAKVKKAATSYAKNVAGGAKIVGSAVSSATKKVSGSSQSANALNFGGVTSAQITPKKVEQPFYQIGSKTYTEAGLKAAGIKTSAKSGALVNQPSLPAGFYPQQSTSRSGISSSSTSRSSISSFSSPSSGALSVGQFGGDTSSGFSTQSLASNPVGARSTPSTNVISTQMLGAENTRLNVPAPIVPDYSLDIPPGAPVSDPRAEIEAEQKKTQDDYMASLMDDFENKKSPAEIESKLRKELQIKQKQQLVSDLTGQLNGIVAKGEANQLSLVGQGRGIPEAIIGGQQAQIGRETAIAALPVQAQLSAAQGNLEMANDSLDRLFKIYSEEAENEYQFRKEQKRMVYEFATADQKKKLEVLDKKDARALQEQDAMLADGKSYAKMAFANGQSSLGAKIMALNPKSPAYQSDLVQLISQIKDPNMALDLAIKNQQLAKLQRETSLLGEPSAADRKKEAQALLSSQGQTDVLKEKVTLIDSILTSGGMSARVGTNILARTPKGLAGVVGKALTGVGLLGLPFDAYAKVSGTGQQFSGGVHKLASKEFLDALIGAKQQGATFGALTDREGDALRASATQLNDWEIKNDKGLGAGIWNIDEQSFIKELNNLKRLANKGIQNYQGTVFEQEEQSLLDNIFSPETMALDPSLYY